jgi:predicted nuclease of predicted toxin-antitoxin system
VKFLIDMPVTPRAVEHLVAAGHDAVHAATIGLSEASDADIIVVARREGRIVVTADLDYPRLLALEHTEGPGIILFRGGSYSDTEMLGLLDRVLAPGPTASALDRSITVIDRRRIRRRSLPPRTS